MSQPPTPMSHQFTSKSTSFPSPTIGDIENDPSLMFRQDNIPLNEEYSNFDVFIAGSGPIAATYARLCVEAKLRVLMIEIGAAESFKSIRSKDGSPEVFVPGAHKKNETEFQLDIDRFVNVIKGDLSTVSVAVNNDATDTLDPSSWVPGPGRSPDSNGKNPNQSPLTNLSAEAVTRCVGGMSTHWTCCTPRFDPPIERPKLFDDTTLDNAEWDKLYNRAEELIGTSSTQFDRSIRHTLVLETLQDAYKHEKRQFKPLPLACQRLDNPDHVEWHSAETIFRDLFVNPEKKKLFKLLTNHRCTRLVLDKSSTHPHIKIEAAEVLDLLAVRNEGSGGVSCISAKVFVICAGAIATPQILFNSGFAMNPKSQGSPRSERAPSLDQTGVEWKLKFPLIPNIGHYITEQTMSFCQVVLKDELVESVEDDKNRPDWWKEAVKRHKVAHPKDPIPIPWRDPEPQVTTPFSVDQSSYHPWHTQIHRESFSYGAVGESMDTRLVVDLRFFGYVTPEKRNVINFETTITDAYGMPQPTFDFKMNQKDAERHDEMMADMCDVAMKLGEYLPGSEPQFLAPGLALHLGGTVRAGLTEKETVVNTDSKVWNFDNLYVGGNGVIPTSFAANPTLTSIAYAIKAANAIIAQLSRK